MNILVLGHGAREHALAWKIRQSPLCNRVYLNPGNGGTRFAGLEGLNVDIKDKAALIRAVRSEQIDLVVIGPEALLAEGYADALRSEGILTFGPSAYSAQLETSKVFAKQTMIDAGVPTAPCAVVDNLEALSQNLSARTKWPVVLKLDGLAAGKGVVIAQSEAEGIEFGQRIWDDEEFGAGPQRLLIEEFIRGFEISYIGFCDGRTFVPLSSATDYKRIGDGDVGPNTGGMGAVSPSPYLTPTLEGKIRSTIIQPLLTHFSKIAFQYRGALYIGLMIDGRGNPYVLEFNARFGDPETQAIMLRLENGLVEALTATAQGKLSTAPALTWRKEVALYVVLAAEGYPGKPRTGDVIEGLKTPTDETQVFFAGARTHGHQLVTDGGRVLGVGARGTTVEIARSIVYRGLKNISWRGLQYRKDIGLRRETGL